MITASTHVGKICDRETPSPFMFLDLRSLKPAAPSTLHDVGRVHRWAMDRDRSEIEHVGRSRQQHLASLDAEDTQKVLPAR